MNPKVIERIKKIVEGEIVITKKAYGLALEFGIRNFQTSEDFHRNFGGEKTVKRLLEHENLSPNELKNIALFALAIHQEKPSKLLSDLIERIKAEMLYDWMAKQLFINDYHLIDTLLYLTGHDQLQRPCPQCPIRKPRA